MRDSRALRLLLLLYPRSFRARHTEALVALVRDQVARARTGRGSMAARTVLLHALLDTLLNLPLAWRDAMRDLMETRMTAFSLESLSLDLRLASRRLLRTPGFAAAAILTLGVALGAATAVYSLINQVLLQPLPYTHAERLVSLWESTDGRDISVSWPNYEDWTARTASFDALAAYTRRNVTVTGAGDAARVRGLGVTSNLFSTVGTEPFLGRFFDGASDLPGSPAEVVLTHAMWTDQFGADPQALGQAIALDGEVYTVVGVAPPGFRFPDGISLGYSDLFLPMGVTLAEDDRGNRDAHPGLYAVGRLRPGVDLTSARTELASLSADLERSFPDANEGYQIRSEAALESVTGEAGATLLLAAIAVGMVLLVAAANVSALFLARGWAREADTGVQLALGAGRTRLARQMILESVLIGAAAAAVGLLVSYGALLAARPLLGELPRAPQPMFDAEVALFAFAASMLTALLVGLLPALRGRRGGGGMPGSRGVAGNRREGRLRDGLVAAEVALSVVLLVGATLLVRSLDTVRGMDVGVRADDVLSFRVGLPAAVYGEREAEVFFTRLSEELSVLPGVVSVGGISVLPFSGSGSQSGIAPAGGTRDDEISTDVQVALPGYFESMGIELRRGRLLDEGDGAGAAPAAVVDERFARTFFGEEDPIGRTVQGWGFPEIEIVGVVGDVQHYGALRTARETLYIPHAQRPWVNMNMVVRASSDPSALVPAIRARLNALDPQVPLMDPGTMEDRIAGTLRGPTTAAVLGSIMAALGALLSLVGVHALVAYAVSRRTREIGVRMALGARGGSVRSTLLLSTLRPALVGLGVGLAAAMLAGRGIRAWIHGLSPLDPTSYAVAGVALLAVIVLAGWVPARRVTRVDPVRALRAE